MTKVLIIKLNGMYQLSCEYNKGSAAVAKTTVETLRKYLSDARFTSLVQFSEDFARENDVTVIKNKLFASKGYSLGTMVKSSLDLARCALWAVLRRPFPRAAGMMVNNRVLKEYAGTDVIIDISMDLFCDRRGAAAIAEHCKSLLMGVLLKKPVVIWAQSPGPFRSKLTSWLVRLTLDRVALIILRDEISLDYVRELGVKRPPIHVTADTAFLLEPAPEERFKEILSREGISDGAGNLIGLTVCWSNVTLRANTRWYLRFLRGVYQVARAVFPEGVLKLVRRQKGQPGTADLSGYREVGEMARVVDYLAQKPGATVVLIPHDYNPSGNDRLLLGAIFQKAKTRDNVKLLAGDYTAAELKAVIAHCALFVGGKMHADIAATSMGVPTVAIQYGHKFYGIMRQLGLEEYICNLSAAEIERKIDEMWARKEKVRSELKVNSEAVKEQARHNGELVRDLLAVREDASARSAGHAKLESTAGPGRKKRIEMNQTIASVVADGLCTGCGTCAGICPGSAVEMTLVAARGTYLPRINEEKCNRCGICATVCPGESVNFGRLNQEIFGRQPEDVLAGNYRSCHIGYAGDYNTRYNSASGGLVTKLLTFALEQGIITGALVTGTDEARPLEPWPFIARTREDIIAAARSKYCPVPANVALAEIIRSEGRFAVVGLPCHIQAIRKAEAFHKKLREKIVLHVGIFCSHPAAFGGIKFLLHKYGVDPGEVARLDYRGEGWPGKMSIHLKNGSKKLVPFMEYNTFSWGLGFYCPPRCTLCIDQGADFADISCGDAWVPDAGNDKIGTSAVIARNEIGEKLLQAATAKGEVTLRNLDITKVKDLSDKKQKYAARSFLARLSGRKIPDFGVKLPAGSFSSYFDALKLNLYILLSRRPFWWFIELMGYENRAEGKLSSAWRECLHVMRPVFRSRGTGVTK